MNTSTKCLLTFTALVAFILFPSLARLCLPLVITQRCDKSSNSQKHQQVSSQWAHAECKFPGAKLQQSSDSFDSIYGTPWNSPVNGDLIMLFIFHEENALKLFFQNMKHLVQLQRECCWAMYALYIIANATRLETVGDM